MSGVRREHGGPVGAVRGDAAGQDPGTSRWESAARRQPQLSAVPR
ncbi:hypothetical protein ACN263_21320 [Micromonospora sp. WMMD729]